MAWTAPRTWVTAEIVSASLLNTHVRDNFNETAPAKATANTIIIGSTTNAIVARNVGVNSVTTTETTTSTAYTDLATTGPTATLTTGTTVGVSVMAQLQNNTGGNIAFASYAVTGASAISPTDTRAVLLESSNANDAGRFGFFEARGDLTAGSNTFTMKYRVDGGTGTFANRRMIIFPMS